MTSIPVTSIPVTSIPVTRPLRVVFVGLGGVGQRHLRNLRRLLGDTVDIHAYRVRRATPVLTDDLRVEAGQDLEVIYGVRCHETLESALAMSPDIAFVCNPSSMHVSVARTAAEAGCHLFLEKPVSNTMDGVEDLRAIVREKRLTAMVGYQLRFHPCIRQLKDWWAAGVVGRPLAMHVAVGEHLADWHRYEDYRSMYAARADLGGGVVLSQIHEFDYVYDLLGMPRRVTTCGGHLTDLEIDVEDVAVSMLDYVHEGRPLPVIVHQDYIQRPAQRSCVVIGDRGQIRIDLAKLTAERRTADGLIAESLDCTGFQRNELFMAELRHFLDCVMGNSRPLITLDDGIASLRIALAARESLRTGRCVEVST